MLSGHMPGQADPDRVLRVPIELDDTQVERLAAIFGVEGKALEELVDAINYRGVVR